MAIYKKIDGTTLYLRGDSTEGYTEYTGSYITGSSSTNATITSVVVENTISGKDLRYMFFNCTSLTYLDLSNLDTSISTDMTYMFGSCLNLTTLIVSNLFTTSNVIYMDGLFSMANSNVITTLINRLDTSKVVSMDYMFKGVDIDTLDLSHFNTSNVMYMQSMFRNVDITNLNISNFNFEKVINTSSMFYTFIGQTIILPDTLNFSSLTNCRNMFYDCTADLNNFLTKFDFSNLPAFDNFLQNCTSYNCNIDVSVYPINTDFTTMYVKDMSLLILPEGYKCLYYKVNNNILYLRQTETTGYTTYYGGLLLSAPDASAITSVICEEQLYPTCPLNKLFRGFNTITTLDLTYLHTNLVSNMEDMFYNCTSLTNLIIPNIDTSSCKDLSHMFCYCYELTNNINSYISNWDTSKCTDMEYMFACCRNITTFSVSNWNVSNCENIIDMFEGCSSLTNIDINNWNTSKIYLIADLFKDCSSLTSINLSNWDVHLVQMASDLFSGCTSITSINLDNWNTECLQIAFGMFYNCSNLTTLNLNHFNMSYVRSAEEMFRGCTKLTTLNISDWDLSSATDLSYMFYNCSSLTTLDLSNWSTARTTNKSYMFAGCTKLTTIKTSDLWSNSAVTNSANMFSNCTALRGAISYNSSKIDATYANYTTGYFTHSLIYWAYTSPTLTISNSVVSGTSFGNFDVAAQFIDAEWTGDIGWKTIFYDMMQDCTSIVIASQIKPKYLDYWFSGLMTVSNITGISNINTDICISMKYVFNNCGVSGFSGATGLTSLDLSSWNTSKVTTMQNMFSGTGNSFTQGVGTPSFNLTLTGFDTSKVTDMSWMFNSCKASYVNINMLNTSNVTTMSHMFSGFGIRNRTLNLSHFDVGKVTNMSYMFETCYCENVVIDGWNTASLTNMSYMFTNNSDLEYNVHINYNQINTSKVTDMSYVIYRNQYLPAIDVSSWDTSNVTNMKWMFGYCTSLTSLDLCNFVTHNVTNMQNMFSYDSALTRIDIDENNWDISNCDTTVNAFTNCISIVGKSGKTYSASEQTLAMANTATGYLNNPFLIRLPFLIAGSYFKTISCRLRCGSYWGSLVVTNVATGATLLDLYARDSSEEGSFSIIPGTQISVTAEMPNQHWQTWTVDGVSTQESTRDPVTNTYTITDNKTIYVDIN